MDLTGQAAWSSSGKQIATIGATTGLATAVGQGTATITALYSNSGTAATGTATFTVVGGTTEQFTAVSITPGSLALSASGQTSQLIALGTSGSTGLLQNVTDSIQIQWSSSIPSIASVSASGLVTGLSAGTSTITALLTNPDGSVVSKYRDRRGFPDSRAGASTFPHDHSEFNYRWQFTGYGEFPGGRNVLVASVHTRSDGLRDLTLFCARRFPGQLE